MATYQILYWMDLPSQVRAEDETDEVKMELGTEFQDKIDRVATDRNLVGSDEYLEGWRWSEPEERPGTAQQVAEALKKELESQA